MSDLDEMSRAIGRMEGQLESVVVKLDHMHTCIESLKTTRSENKGAWKAITLIGGGAGAALGLIAPWITKKLGW